MAIKTRIFVFGAITGVIAYALLNYGLYDYSSTLYKWRFAPTNDRHQVAEEIVQTNCIIHMNKNDVIAKLGLPSIFSTQSEFCWEVGSRNDASFIGGRYVLIAEFENEHVLKTYIKYID